MKTGYALVSEQWEEVVKQALQEFFVYAPIKQWGEVDYKLIRSADIPFIIYNYPRPLTPLKAFLLPIKENVTVQELNKKQIILGVPSCDLHALQLLDSIYLDKSLPDIIYQRRRENTLLFGSDCHFILENCHCSAYGLKPYPEKNQDIILNKMGDKVFIQSSSKKGKEFIKNIADLTSLLEADEEFLSEIQAVREKVLSNLDLKNKKTPDHQATGMIVQKNQVTTWKKYASQCVSCGACAAICPTCSCFQLIDRPGFEKIRNLDTCQYPGFEKVASGEDPLRPLINRLKNRYLCKYVWKTERFKSLACTGCGRCIDACIGKINKNELILELMETDLA
jgi:sulfhydrogenase subunit beta (sulfur reductase)